MNMDNNFAEKQNEKFWDEVAPIHFKSYNIDALRQGISCIDEIQKQELYPIAEKKLLHLQCHIGTDSISLALDGAQVTAVDFSKKSIELAKRLNQEIGTNVEFIQANIFSLKDILKREFDIVYTSQGVLAWIKDINVWASIIYDYLKIGGVFYIMEIHLINALIKAGLDIVLFNEYDKLFYNGLPGMQKDKNGWWFLDKYKNMIPYTFTLKARKNR